VVRRRPRARTGRLTTVDIPGFAGTVHVREDGPQDGPVLVLLHGFGGSLQWFDLVVPLLEEALRLVRVDLLGHGSTGGPAADAPLQAAMVEAVLAELGLAHTTVLGHSFGADVAVELAERSTRVDRLVIVTQAPDYSDATLPRGRAVMTVPVLNVALHRFAPVLGTALKAVVGRRRPAVARRLAVQALADVRALDVGMYDVVLVRRRDRLARRPLDELVRAAGKPTLVLLGGRDRFYGDRSAGRYRGAGARVEILADSGHSPLVEMPERAAALIRGFVAEPAVR
jgi:pimeloyl-ACP methyl ester carboxylesterase